MRGMKEKIKKIIALLMLSVFSANSICLAEEGTDEFVIIEEELHPVEAFSQSSQVVVENSGQTTATNGVQVTWKQYSKRGGGINLTAYTGVSRQKLLETLETRHSSYLGVPYEAGYSASESGMNCEGFVERVLADAGNSKHIASGAGGRGWVNTLRENNITYRTYYSDSFNALADIVVNDGYAQPGDIIWLWDGGNNDEYYRDINYVGLPTSISSIHHIGFFIGNYFSTLDWSGSIRGIYDRNGFWHSVGTEGISSERFNEALCSYNKNVITQLNAKSSNCKYITVIKFANQNSESVLYKNVQSEGKSYSARDAVDYGFPAVNGARYVMFCKDAFVPYRKYWNNSSPTISEYLEGVIPDKTNAYNCYNDIKATATRLNYEQYADVNEIDSSGKAYAVFRDVPPGTYFIMETDAPAGYNLDERIYVVRVGAGETISSGNVGFVTSEEIINRYGSLEIHKVCEESTERNGSWELDYVPLENVTFSIYAYEDTPNQTYKKDELVETIKTNAEGIARTMVKLPEGKYYVVENCDTSEYYEISPVNIEISYASPNMIVGNNPITGEIEYIDVERIELVNQRRVVISTTAMDKYTGKHEGMLSDKVDIKDTVHCENLLVGHGYRLEACLMDADTGQLICDGDREVRAQKEFDAVSGDMDVEILLETLSGDAVKNKTVVVYERLYEGQELRASHEDLLDENQSVTYPDISTTLLGKTSDKHVAFAGAQTVLVDTIKYSNLVPDREYVAESMLVDKKDGSPILIDDEPLVVRTPFTPSEKDGTIDIEFSFDASSLAGRSIVAYEYIYSDSILIAKHEDINSYEQCLDFPDIGTVAKSDSGDKYIDYGKDVKLVDTISYTNLNTDYEYTAIGTLMIKSQNKPLTINGECVTSMVVFSPKEKNGSVDVEFDINTSSLDGEELVVYETIFVNAVNEEDEAVATCIVAEHKILEDEGQTVRVRQEEVTTEEVTTEEVTTEEVTTEEVTTEEVTTEEVTTEEITTEVPTTVEATTEYFEESTQAVPETKVVPNTKSAKTGDRRPVLPIIILALVCAGSAIAMLIIKLRYNSTTNKKDNF